MKKTLIAILALGGMAMADSDLTTVTFDSYYTPAGGEAQDIISACVGKEASSNLGNGLMGDKLKLSDGSNFNVVVADLMSSELIEPSTSLTLNSFGMLSRPDHDGAFIDPGFTVTITIGENSWTSTGQVYDRTGGAAGNGYCEMYFDFDAADAPIFTQTDTLKVTLNSNDTGKQIGFGCIQAIDGSVLSVGNDYNYGGWKTAVRLHATVVPEPATATLSLLALAGLAARRRRH